MALDADSSGLPLHCVALRTWSTSPPSRLYLLCTPRHMIDLSEEPMDENIGICVDYLTRMTKMGARLVLPPRT